MLSAGPLELWHYIQASQHPAETALRAALLLLHLLYAANVHRQQRRLQMSKKLQQLDNFQPSRRTPYFPAGATGAATAGHETGAGAQEALQQVQQQQQTHQEEKEELSEVDFSLFHNDAINSSHQMLQHEFALWLRLRRGAAAPAVSSFLLQQALQQQQQRDTGSRSRDRNSLSTPPDSESATSSLQTPPAATAASGATAPAATAPAGTTPAVTPTATTAARNGVLPAATAAAAEEAAETTAAAGSAALHSMSAQSLFSGGAEAEAALGMLPPDPGVPAAPAIITNA